MRFITNLYRTTNLFENFNEYIGFNTFNAEMGIHFSIECLKRNVLIEIEALLPGFAGLLWWRIKRMLVISQEHCHFDWILCCTD